MAEIDTGLGWSANASWLIQTGSFHLGDAGAYSYAPTPDVPLPVSGSSPAEVYQFGNLVAESSEHKMYATADVPGAMFLRFQNQDGGMLRMENYSPISGAHAYLVVYEISTSLLSDTFVITTGDEPFGTYSGVPWYGGMYPVSINFGHATFYVSSEYPPFIIPNFTFTGSAITKVNPGYCVACNARWKTQNGTVIYSPVLISSDPEFVEMAMSVSGYDFAVLNALKDGLQFYMGFWNITDKVVQANLPVFDMGSTSDPYLTLPQLFKLIASADYANIHVSISPDPYTEGTSPSEEEGGNGDGLEDDGIGIDGNTPHPSAASAGLYQVYTPTVSELQALSNYLWSSNFDIDQVKKLFSSPMDSILGLSAVPVTILGGTPRQLTIGGVTLTGVYMAPVASEYRTVDMGSITVKERYGSYLDYEPFTRFSIVLPYIGIKEISTDDIMNKTIHLRYDLEVVSGAIIARMEADGKCLYEWTGNCAMQLPVTGRSFDNLVTSAIGVASTAVLGIATSNPGLLASSVASAAVQAISTKPTFSRSGQLSGVAGFLGQQRPYLIRQTPNAYIPADQNKYIGYPSYISVNLASLTGYNVIESIHLENIPATSDEINELENILKGGVIF